MRRLLPLLLASLAACGGRLYGVRDLPPAPPPAVAASTLPPEAPHAPQELHGHRDFPVAFERVWDATIQAVHAAGIAVPLEQRQATHEGRIDVDALLVEVEARAPGRVCVFVRFRGVSREVGEQRAAALLGEVQRRLALPR